MWASAQPKAFSLYNPWPVANGTTKRGCAPSAQEDEGFWNQIPPPVCSPTHTHLLKRSRVLFLARPTPSCIVCAQTDIKAGAFCSYKESKLRQCAIPSSQARSFMLSPFCLHSTDQSWVLVILFSKVHTVHTHSPFTSVKKIARRFLGYFFVK